MKILLINPPRSSINNVLNYAPEEAKKFIHKKLIGPPLGLLTIAGVVKDYDVKFIDLKGEYDLYPDAPALDKLISQYVNEFNPDIIGVTFIASEFPYGIEIFQTAKKINSSILTVAGGLHVTLCPEDFNDKSVDVLIPGQNANIFRMVVQAKEKNQPLKDIANIYINTKDGLKFTYKKAEGWDPIKKDFIMPDRSLLKRWISTYKIGNQKATATYINSSYGCPYECTFCSIWPQFDGKYFQRDIESVISELKTLDDYEHVRFADANTIVNIKFVDKLFDRIIEENIKKVFVMDIRFDTTVKYPKLIEKLARGGLKVVICGFESPNEDELKKYKKDSNASLIEKAIKIFHDCGIMLRGNYIIPNTYDLNDFKILAEYSSSHKINYAGYSILTPMPGTVFYNEIKKDIIDFDLTKYNFFNCVLKTKLPIEEFYENVGKLWLIKEGDDVLS